MILPFLSYQLVPIRKLKRTLISFQFGPPLADFDESAGGGHKGLRRGVLFVRRESKPAENAAHRKKGHFRMETN